MALQVLGTWRRHAPRKGLQTTSRVTERAGSEFSPVQEPMPEQDASEDTRRLKFPPLSILDKGG